MADVLLAQRAENGVADRVHQRIRVRMAVQPFRVWNLHAAQDELASRDQLMNVVTDAHVNHEPKLEGLRPTSPRFFLSRAGRSDGEKAQPNLQFPELVRSQLQAADRLESVRISPVGSRLSLCPRQREKKLCPVTRFAFHPDLAAVGSARCALRWTSPDRCRPARVSGPCPRDKTARTRAPAPPAESPARRPAQTLPAFHRPSPGRRRSPFRLPAHI